MPVFLFTWHAYGTWLPDRPQGYVKRDLGLLPPDPEMASRYRQNMKQGIIAFNSSFQRLLIDTALEAAHHQRLETHAIATDPSHIHDLCLWRDKRNEIAVAAQLRRSLTRALNTAERDGRIGRPARAVGTIHWFTGNTHRKRVRDEEHLRYLLDEYLPDHPGWCWSRSTGHCRPKAGSASS